MKEIMYGDETVKVLEATEYDDIHYWGMKAKIEFKGETYSLFDAGSGSGYDLCCSGITKCDFDRLYGEEQHEIDESDWDYFEDTIRTLLGEFIASCAKESWESQEDDDFDMHILIDGVEQEGEGEGKA